MISKNFEEKLKEKLELIAEENSKALEHEHAILDHPCKQQNKSIRFSKGDHDYRVL